jgi:hypothetical protein
MLMSCDKTSFLRLHWVVCRSYPSKLELYAIKCFAKTKKVLFLHSDNGSSLFGLILSIFY